MNRLSIFLIVIVVSLVTYNSASGALLIDGEFIDRKPLHLKTTEGTWLNLTVSPDGEAIVFQMLGQLFQLPLDGGMAIQRTDGWSYNEYPLFSLDGDKLLFISDRSGNKEVWSVDYPSFDNYRRVDVEAATDFRQRVSSFSTFDKTDAPYLEKQVLARSQNEVHYTAPAILEPTKRFGNCGDVYWQHGISVRAKGHDQPIAMLGPYCIWHPRRLPVGAFTPKSDGFIAWHDGKIVRVNLPLGEISEIPFTASVELAIRPLQIFQQRISQSPTVIARRPTFPTLSPDGNYVAFSAFDRIWVQGVGDERASRLTNSPYGEYDPAWSPNGKELAFATWVDSERGGHIVVADFSKNCLKQNNCRTRRLTAEPALYGRLIYSMQGTAIYASYINLSRARAYEQTAGDMASKLTHTPPEQIISVMTSNAASTVEHELSDPDTYHQIGQYGGRLGVRGVGGNSGPEQIVFGVYEAGSAHGRVNAVRALTVDDKVEIDAKLHTLFKVVDPNWRPDASTSDEIRSNVNIDDISLSPDLTKAVLVINRRELFLVDTADFDKDPYILFPIELLASKATKITSNSNGGEFVQWSSDSRHFTYSFGNAFFLYDLEDAAAARYQREPYSPKRIELTAERPRDLPTGRLLLENARIITMSDQGVIEKGDVYIKNGRISWFGPSGGKQFPMGVKRFDISEKVVIPGLVDSHNHVIAGGREFQRRHRIRQFESNLAYGVLNSRNAQEYRAHIHRNIEDRRDVGDIRGARILTTGPGITSVTKEEIASIDVADEIVSRYKNVYKVKWLKDYMTLGRAQRIRLVRAADAYGLNVFSHGHGLEMLITNTIDGFAGYDHALELGSVYDDVIQLASKSGIALAHNAIEQNSMRMITRNWTDQQQEKFEFWFGEDESSYRGWRENEVASFQVTRDLRIIPKLYASGVNVIVGGHGDTPGLSTHFQVWSYVEAGMSEADALEVGTLRTAKALGLDRDIGSIERGKLADLLVLNGDPLDDIRSTMDIDLVVFNGRVYDADRLQILYPEQN